jgi:hypothetical protein
MKDSDDGKSSPRPEQKDWGTLYQRLVAWAQTHACEPAEPPKPMFLGAHWHSTDAEKEMRWREMRAWAERNECRHLLEEVPKSSARSPRPHATTSEAQSMPAALVLFDGRPIPDTKGGFSLEGDAAIVKWREMQRVRHGSPPLPHPSRRDGMPDDGEPAPDT